MVELAVKADNEKETFTNVKFHVLGASGFVFSGFDQRYKDQVESTPRSQEVDITDHDSVSRWAERVVIDRNSNIILASAFTDAKSAETEKGNPRGRVYLLNTEGARIVAKVVKSRDASLTLISTGFVFDPSIKGPIPENLIPKAQEDLLSWYGYTKLLGEEAAQDIFGGFDRLAIVRFDYPFDPNDFPKADNARRALKLFDQGKLYPVFVDQIFAPAPKVRIQETAHKIALFGKSGVYHVAPSDRPSFHEWTDYIIEIGRGVKGSVPKGNLVEYRKNNLFANFWPLDGGLESKTSEEELGVEPKTWREDVEDFVKRLPKAV